MRRTVSVTTVVVALLLSAVAAQQPVPAPRPVWQWAYPGILAHERRPGIRCPSWDVTRETLPLIRELGFLYDSSLMADDRPYEIVADGQPTGIIELPVEWILDDFAYYSYDRPNSAYLRVADNDVFEVYKAEFDRAYEEGTMFLVTLHPQMTGHRSRIGVLERLIARMKSKPGVWFATHEQVARAAAEQLKR